MGRPVAVLDACVLVPPGLRDVLLSVADAGAYRPVWQSEIEAEVLRNVVALRTRQGVIGSPAAESEATTAARRTLAAMNSAFPDAALPSRRWAPLVPRMTNDPADRHVLAAAVRAPATHVVTNNIRHFPVRTRPAGVSVVTPDAFALHLLRVAPDLVVEALTAKVARHRHPPFTLEDLAVQLGQGQFLRRFGTALADGIARRAR